MTIGNFDAEDNPLPGAAQPPSTLGRETGEFLSRLVDALPFPFYVIDAGDFTITLANNAAGDTVQAGETLCYALHHRLGEPCQLSAEECPVQIAKRTGEPVTVEHVHYDADGERHVVEVHAFPHLGSDGTVSHVVEIVQDLTERRETERVLRRRHEQLQARMDAFTHDLVRINRELAVSTRAEWRARQLTHGLIEATTALTDSLELGEVLDRILTQVQRVIETRSAAIVLRHDHDGEEHWEARLIDGANIDAAPETFTSDIEPLLRQMRASHEALLIPDVTKAEPQLSICGFPWVRSYVGIPMSDGEEVVGFLNVLDDLPVRVSEETVGLLRAFASHAVVAIRNARAFESEMRARETAETLSAVSRALLQTLDIEAVLNALLDSIQHLVPYDNAHVGLMRDEHTLAIRAARGAGSTTVPLNTIDTETEPVVHALVGRKRSILVTEADTSPEWRMPHPVDSVRSWLGIPLVSGDQVIGVCSLARTRKEPFTQRDVDLVEMLVAQAAVAVQNAWLFDQLRMGRERLQSLTRRLVDAQETERRYVARELHDDAGQALASLMMGLRLAEREADNPDATRRNLATLRGIADGVLDNLHRLAVNLRPASLDHGGLVTALQQYLEDVSSRGDLTVDLEVVGINERLPAQVETALYRVAQEAVTNVVRHAAASRVDVLLAQRDSKLVLVVEDNGAGFDPNSLTPADHLGLFGLQERAEMLDGELIIESKAGTGTTVVMEIPYPSADGEM